MNIYKKMKDIIRKILREERSQTPKIDYYKKVAEMIVDNDIEIDHENRLIYFPFSGGYSRRESFDGGLTDYVQKRKDEHEDLFGKDFPTYLQHMYGLDVQDKRGIMMVIMKLIKKRLNKRMKNEKYN
jgi:hypothetical protein